MLVDLMKSVDKSSLSSVSVAKVGVVVVKGPFSDSLKSALISSLRNAGLSKIIFS